MEKLKTISVRLTTIPLAFLLIAIIVCSTVENLHSALLDFGEGHWSGYSELRQPAERPTCDDAATQPAAAPDEDDALLDDLFGGEEEEASADAQEAARAVCAEKMAKYEDIVKRQDDSGLRFFVPIERAIGDFAANSVAFGRHFLVLVFIFCGLATTIQRQHLGLRTPTSKRSDRLSQIAQAIGNLIVVASFAVYYRQDLNSGVDNVSNLPVFWMIAFGLMALTNIFLAFRPIAGEEAPAQDGAETPAAGAKEQSVGGMLLCIPLYAYMAVICGLYFALGEQHLAGVATYITQMTEHADLYTNVALYVFCGMMLKNTDIADKFLAILRPFKLSPELLVFVIVLLSALPTAYSGASGIFVIAAGAIIYRELKQSKARDGLALAGTAMSGSMGIVLSPCLLVVIVAALNKDVTTTELFSAGFNVFLVNIFVFAIVLFAMKQGPVSCENPIKALPDVGRAVVAVLPYIAIGAAVLLVMRYGLGAAFDEYSAPALLPFVLLVLLIYDRLMARRAWRRLPETERPEAAPAGIGRALFESVNSTSIHAGGLLSLMTLSVCIGGIIDRANLNALLPQHFASPFIAMALLFVILVIIGMIMDPYGAVILVSATLTQIAYANGIAPIHFWVTVLSAFELGYLTPPVALNQLLTRQVVGEKAFAFEQSDERPKKFWYRHERILMPVAVKGIVLLLVAFLPLIIQYMRMKLR